jgi:hypothetical protein
MTEVCELCTDDEPGDYCEMSGGKVVHENEAGAEGHVARLFSEYPHAYAYECDWPLVCPERCRKYPGSGHWHVARTHEGLTNRALGPGRGWGGEEQLQISVGGVNRWGHCIRT